MTPKIRSTPRARGEASNLSKTLFVFFLSVRSSGMMLRNWLSWFKKTSWGPRGSLSTGWPPPPCPPWPPTLPQSPFKPSNVLPATLAFLSAARKFIARNKTWQELWMASFVCSFLCCSQLSEISGRVSSWHPDDQWRVSRPWWHTSRVAMSLSYCVFMIFSLLWAGFFKIICYGSCKMHKIYIWNEVINSMARLTLQIFMIFWKTFKWLKKFVLKNQISD